MCVCVRLSVCLSVCVCVSVCLSVCLCLPFVTLIASVHVRTQVLSRIKRFSKIVDDYQKLSDELKSLSLSEMEVPALHRPDSWRR